jgi:hypothetical protein
VCGQTHAVIPLAKAAGKIVKAQILATFFGIGMALSSLSAWAELSDADAIDLARAMSYSERSYSDIVLTLMMEGRTLSQATHITMQVTETFSQRTTLTRTVLCMSRNNDEAEQVMRAAIEALPPADPAIQEIISEHVKYQRSSCLDQEILKRPPVEYATGDSDNVVSTSQ